MSSFKGTRSTEAPGVDGKLVSKQKARAAVQEKVTWWMFPVEDRTLLLPRHHSQHTGEAGSV